MVLFNFYHIHLSLFIQTLTTLGLGKNQIGDEGGKAIGQALQTNKVTQTMILFNFYHIHLSLFIQTLTTLNLNWNQIGYEGRQHLLSLTKKRITLNVLI